MQYNIENIEQSLPHCIQDIVLVTWKGGENFGTCLQGYALQEKLVSLGYRVHILSDVPHAKKIKS